MQREEDQAGVQAQLRNLARHAGTVQLRHVDIEDGNMRQTFADPRHGDLSILLLPPPL